MTKKPDNADGFSGPVFRRRLAYYLVGLAIGLFMLGLLHKAKSNAANQSAESTQSEVNPK